MYSVELFRWLRGSFMLSLFYPLLAAGACVEMTREIHGMHLERILLEVDDGSQVALDVRVADDGAERAAGFQHVCPQTIENTLILFRYPTEVTGRFHMQNVYAPLDIVFFDSAGKVVDLMQMQTYTENQRPLYGPGGSFQFALEAPAGFFEALGIAKGNFQLIQP